MRKLHVHKLARIAPALVLALAATAHAGGVSLRWDNCYSDGGVINKTFACDTNTGSERLVLSYVLDSPMPDVSGGEIRMFINAAGATLPSWWSMKNAGTCRLHSLGFDSSPPPGSVNCEDWSSGAAAGGIGSYYIGYMLNADSFSAGIVSAVAVPPTQLATLARGQEYFAASITIDHVNTVSPGACGGCDVPVCIVFDRLNVTTPTLSNNRLIQQGAFGADSQFARWQNGQETNVQFAFHGTNSGSYHTYDCVLSSTPTRTSTWGAVKALYR